MYLLEKEIEISSSHELKLPYESKCERIHGHNWLVTLKIQSELLTPAGMVVDFEVLKKVLEKYDHQFLNNVLPPGMNPTAENLAVIFSDEVQKILPESAKVAEVVVQESKGNIIKYSPPIASIDTRTMRG